MRASALKRCDGRKEGPPPPLPLLPPPAGWARAPLLECGLLLQWSHLVASPGFFRQQSALLRACSRSPQGCLVAAADMPPVCPIMPTLADERLLQLHGQVHRGGGQVCGRASGLDKLRHCSGETVCTWARAEARGWPRHPRCVRLALLLHARPVLLWVSL